MAGSERRIRFRFSLGFLLLVMTCVAAWLVAFRRGYDAGERAYGDEVAYAVIYDISDFVASTAESAKPLATSDEMERLVRSTLDTERDSSAEVSYFSANKALVVAANKRKHEVVANLLNGLRRSDAAESQMR